MKYFLSFFFLLFWLTNTSFSQKTKLKYPVDINRLDTLDIIILDSIQLSIRENNPTEAYYISRLQDSICNINLDKTLDESARKNYLNRKSNALNNMGFALTDLGQFEKAKPKFLRSLSIRESLNDQNATAGSHLNLARILDAQGDHTTAKIHFDKGIALCREVGNELWEAFGINGLGGMHESLGELDEAIEAYEKCLEIFNKLEFTKGQAGSYINLGTVYKAQSNDRKALEYLDKGLAICLKNDLKNFGSRALDAIGGIYESYGEYDLALGYLDSARLFQEEIGDKHGLCGTLLEIALIHKTLSDSSYDSSSPRLAYDSILDVVHELASEMEDMSRIAEVHLLKGDIALERGKLAEAESNLKRAISEYEETRETGNLGRSHLKIAELYMQKRKVHYAVKHAEKANLLALETDLPVLRMEAAHALYKIYKKQLYPGKALKMYETYSLYRDSIENEEKRKEFLKHQFKTAYEAQSYQDSLENAQEISLKDMALSQEKEENAHNQQRILLMSILLLVTLGLGGFALNRYRVSQRQKKLIEIQKNRVDAAYNQLEAKNDEILDSIKYAKRIQKAILPNLSTLTESFPESFVLYQPKDIVAGDFYWFENHNNHLLFAAADCTGHGVPGAMVSVICNNGLNRSVREMNKIKPNEILDSTRAIVVKEFEKSEEKVRDGMDIALCSVQNKKLMFSGANNPLWLIRQGEATFEYNSVLEGNNGHFLYEIKGDRQAIGQSDYPTPFALHEIELLEGDSIIIFSDGFQDQFGGERGKKFKAKQLKQILLSISSESMPKQKEVLLDKFEKWKGDLEQIDDVCMIGVKIT